MTRVRKSLVIENLAHYLCKNKNDLLCITFILAGNCPYKMTMTLLQN